MRFPRHSWLEKVAEIRLWEESVTKRETGFLLIGLGFGLMFAIAAIVEVLLSLYRSAFITTYTGDKFLLIVPVLLLVIGGPWFFTGPRVSELRTDPLHVFFWKQAPIDSGKLPTMYRITLVCEGFLYTLVHPHRGT